MKILILGAGGMLGHKLYKTLSKTYDDVIPVFRKNKEHYHKFNLYKPEQMIGNVDVTNQGKLLTVLNSVKPDIIFNCIGKTTRKISSEDSQSVIYLNSFLPHFISKWASLNNSYFIHFSTDCVFSGKNGPYKPNDFRDSRDLYGLSKTLGETNSKHGLTIRTSIVGREIENQTEFFEWIFSSKNKTVSGYKNVFYSGVTTNYLSDVVAQLITRKTKLSGLIQLASPPISKLNLIKKVNKIFALNIKINTDGSKVSNKVLSPVEFRLTSGIKTQSWDEMLSTLEKENSYYEILNTESGEMAA